MIESHSAAKSRPAPQAQPLAKRAAGSSCSGRLRVVRSKPPIDNEICVSIRANSDILEARRQGRELAASLGFSSIDCTLIATAISELSRNIVLYAGSGEIRLREERLLGTAGIMITAVDQGPGIRDVRSALQDGYSTSRGLGLGLPGVKRIMDEFEVISKPRQGTTVTVKKWKSI